MKLPIFTSIDLEVCTIPNPVGYPLSWTHPSIAYTENAIGGYNYFFAQTPYPTGNDAYENPMMYRANARSNGKPPIVFLPFSGNPLQEIPEGSGTRYNADVDVLIDGGNVYCFNRPYIAFSGRTWVNVQKMATDFSSATPPIDLFDNKTNSYFGYGSTLPTLVSPAFLKVGSNFRSYHLIGNTYNVEKDRMRQIVIMEGTDLVTPNNFTFLKFGSVLSRNYEPWHIDVFTHESKFYAVICCTDNSRPISKGYCAQMLAVSDDGENFRIFPKPLAIINSYRGSAFVRPDGLFVLYTSTTIKVKPEQNSVDGRDILMGSMMFTELLEQLK